MGGGTERLKLLDVVCDYSPDAEVFFVVDAEGGIGIVGRNELDKAFFLVTEVEGLDGELSIEVCHHYIAVLGVFALVDDEYVAIVDIGVLHAFAHYTTVEGALGVVYEFLVEVDALLYVILCRGWKSRI